MKVTLHKIFLSLIMTLIIFSSQYAFCQNGLIGDGFGTNNWTTTDNFTGSVGTSRIGIFTANGTGNRYFRLVTVWGSPTVYNQWGPSSTTSDYAVTEGNEVPASQIIEFSTSKAYYIM